MIKRVVESIFGSRQAREVKKLQPVLQAIHAHEARLAELDEAALKGQTAKFRGILAERTDALKAEVDRIRAAKHDCADPVERDALEGQLIEAERAWKQGIVPEQLDSFVLICYDCTGVIMELFVLCKDARQWSGLFRKNSIDCGL